MLRHIYAQKKREQQKNGQRNITLHAFKMEEVWSLEAGQGKETDFSPQASRNTLADNLILAW